MNWAKSYVYLGGRLLATETPLTTSTTETKYQHPDRLGTRLVTNTGGGVVSENVGLPFGAIIAGESTNIGGSGTKKRFTSYDRSETATSLDYAVNRHYSAAQGRFTQVDPIEMDSVSLEDPQSLNLYAYCTNDPVNHTDPSGLFLKKLFGGIGTAFKWAFRIAAVIVAVIAVMALSAIGQYWGSILITKGLVAALFASSALLATAGWAPGKVGQIAGALVLGGLGTFANGAGNSARTPSTFPSGSVGGVSSLLQYRPPPPRDYGIIRRLAIAAIQAYNARSRSENREYGSEICRDSSGRIYTTPARRGTLDGFSPQPCPNGETRLGVWHTHGANTPGYDNENFSGVSGGNPRPTDDINFAEIRGIPLFLGTPSGRIKVFIPNSAVTHGPGLGRINGGRFLTFKERIR